MLSKMTRGFISVNEQRKHKRHKTRDIFLWVRCLKTDTVGQVLDISSGGMAFSYLADEQPAENQFSRVSLFDRFNVFGSMDMIRRSDNELDPVFQDRTTLRKRRWGGEFAGNSAGRLAMISNIRSKHT